FAERPEECISMTADYYIAVLSRVGGLRDSPDTDTQCPAIASLKNDGRQLQPRNLKPANQAAGLTRRSLVMGRGGARNAGTERLLQAATLHRLVVMRSEIRPRCEATKQRSPAPECKLRAT